MNLKEVGDINRFKEINKGVKGDVILDIGSAEGELFNFLKERHKKVYSLDIANKKGIDFVRNANNKDWKLKMKFDTIVCAGTIEHLDNPIQFIQTCWNYLNDEGRLIISTPNATSLIYLKNPKWGVTYGGHQFCFTKDMLEFLMLKSNFIIVRSLLVNCFWYNHLAYGICSLIERLKGDIIIIGEKFSRK